MRVFISWSGESSKLCAEALRDWLPYMNQAIDPFVSSQDISKGERGLEKIANKLQDCTYGIVCVTRENQSAPWINFESGALSRELGESMLAPFLLDLSVKDLSGPVAQFQATDSTSRNEVLALVKSLNGKCQSGVDHERLNVTFDRFWGDLEGKLGEIRVMQSTDSIPERETSDILNELVALVREQTSRIGNLEQKYSRLSDSTHYAINSPREVTINTGNDQGNLFERAGTMIRIVSKMIGEENVLKTHMSAGDVLEIETNSEGFARSQGVKEILEKRASVLGVGTSIRLEGGARIDGLVFAPF